jgi:CheY-like chemotaxis protein
MVIDDDPQNNLIVKLTIKKYLNPSEIQIFTDSIEGLEWIKNNYSLDVTQSNTVLLLDINMPLMSGWEFLDEFEKLDTRVQIQFIIFMLSSSVDDRDLERSKSCKSVKGYLVKPLKKEELMELIERLDK